MQSILRSKSQVMLGHDLVLVPARGSCSDSAPIGSEIDDCIRHEAGMLIDPPDVGYWPETVVPTDRPRVRFQESFCRADLVQSRQLMTHNGASPPSIDALQNDQSLRHASAIRLTGIWNIRWSITPV
jgi:hypothetical protein